MYQKLSKMLDLGVGWGRKRRVFSFFFFPLDSNDKTNKKGRNEKQRLQNKCVLLGLRVGKLFLDSIIFFSDFSSPSRGAFLIPSSFVVSSSEFPREFFLCFSCYFSFHSNENHLNIIVIFFQANGSSHPTTDPRMYSNSHLYKMDGFFSSSFSFMSWDEYGNCCCC